MVFTRSSGGSESRAAAMVTKMRSNDCAFGRPLVGTLGSGAASGGCNDGHRNARSMRSCAPGWRWIGTRMAAGGTLKATPATVTGSAGAFGPSGGPGQRGHSTCRMKPVAAATATPSDEQRQRQQAAVLPARARRVPR